MRNELRYDHLAKCSKICSSNFITKWRNAFGFYECWGSQAHPSLHASSDFYHSLSLGWDAFMTLPEDTRETIVDALGEMRPHVGPLRYVRESFDFYVGRWVSQEPFFDESDGASGTEAAG